MIHWLQTNLSLTAFDFPSIPAQVISNHNPHQRARGTKASHQWTQEVFLLILHSFSQDHQLLKLRSSLIPITSCPCERHFHGLVVSIDSIPCMFTQNAPGAFWVFGTYSASWAPTGLSTKK